MLQVALLQTVQFIGQLYNAGAITVSSITPLEYENVSEDEIPFLSASVRKLNYAAEREARRLNADYYTAYLIAIKPAKEGPPPIEALMAQERAAVVKAAAAKKAAAERVRKKKLAAQAASLGITIEQLEMLQKQNQEKKPG